MTIADTVAQIAAAPTWDARVALMRQVPELYGTAQHADVWAAIAGEVYVGAFGPDFAYIPWRDDYELAPFVEAYRLAHELTAGFTEVSVPRLQAVLLEEPTTLRVFRTIVAFTQKEFAASTSFIAGGPVSEATVKRMEGGGLPRDAEDVAAVCAALIDGLMSGTVFGSPAAPARRKLDKPDTVQGWDTVRNLAQDGVPLSTFLHQRHYGGAFRQLLDATSTERGDLLEDAVETLVADAGVPYIRTGAHNQADIAKRFNLTVRPAPDFVFYDKSDTLRGLLECKGANDGGTARDKARRFAALREESVRLGGVPLIAVLQGLGWRRTGDALGPVVRDCDGRVFSLATLDEMLSVSPFPQLMGLVEPDA